MFTEDLLCVQWDLAVNRARALVLFDQGAYYHLLGENVNRRKKSYSKVTYHMVFPELTKQAQFSREKCYLELLKSSISFFFFTRMIYQRGSGRAG